MVAELKPVGMLERSLVDQIAACLWRLQRAGRIEIEIMESLAEPKKTEDKKNQLPFNFIVTKTYEGLPGKEFQETPAKGKREPGPAKSEVMRKLTLGQAVRADMEGASVLMKFQRYTSEIDRGLYKAFHELERLQEKRLRKKIIDSE
jgi:hypothetical protein